MRLLPLVVLAGCGSQAPAGGACDPTDDQCGGDNICLVDTCAAAFPHAYTLTDLHVTVPSSAAIRVDISVGELEPAKLVASTDIATGTDVTFAGPFMVMLPSVNTTLLVAAVDTGSGDPLISCTHLPIDTSQLRSREDSCGQAGYRLAYVIEPRD
jgi:hypothetical protein